MQLLAGEAGQLLCEVDVVEAVAVLLETENAGAGALQQLAVLVRDAAQAQLAAVGSAAGLHGLHGRRMPPEPIGKAKKGRSLVLELGQQPPVHIGDELTVGRIQR